MRATHTTLGVASKLVVPDRAARPFTNRTHGAKVLLNCARPEESGPTCTPPHSHSVTLPSKSPLGFLPETLCSWADVTANGGSSDCNPPIDHVRVALSSIHASPYAVNCAGR